MLYFSIVTNMLCAGIVTKGNIISNIAWLTVSIIG